MWTLLITTLIGSAAGYPTTTVIDTTPYEATTINIAEVHKDVALVSYIQHFKNVMAAYVSSQYNNLTVAEMDKVKETLEEFLTSFARDLRDTLQGHFYDLEFEAVDDGMRNETFKDIKSKIVHEFPDISEETAQVIVAKLRRNLFETRHKLDQIIRESQQAQIANS